MFDPYHKWLGIPKDQRPPTLYQLLGIDRDEKDAEVIEEAAIRQTTHLRTYQAGANAAVCARVLGEIAEARKILLDPAKRKAYDEKLARDKPAAPAVAVASQVNSAFADLDVEPVLSKKPKSKVVEPVVPRKPKGHKAPSSNVANLLPYLIGAGCGVVVLLGLYLGGFFSPAKQDDGKKSPLAENLRKNEEKKSEDKKREEKKVDEKKIEDKKVEEKKTEEKKVEEKKVEEKKVEPTEKESNVAQIVKGDWRIEGKDLVQSALILDASLYFGDPSWTDYEFSAEILKEKGLGGKNEGGLALSFRVDPPAKSSAQFAYAGWGGTGSALESFIEGDPIPYLALGSTKLDGFQYNRWHSIKVVVQSDDCQPYVDGVPLLGAKLRNRHAKGKVGLRTWNSVMRYRNLRVADLEGKILFAGLPKLPNVPLQQEEKKVAEEKKATESKNTELAAAPDENKAKELRAALQEKHKQEYLDAKKSPAERAAWAEKLRQLALDTKDNLEIRYALFEEAREQATLAGKSQLALKVVGEIVAEYLVEPLELKKATLGGLVKSVGSKDGTRELVDYCAALAADAVVTDNFALALQVNALADIAARKNGTASLLAQVAKLERELKEASKDFEQVKVASATLQKEPDDPNANFIVGKYLALRRADWAGALPLLAKGGRMGEAGKLRILALKDLETSADEEARVKIGDLWWAVAGTEANAWTKHSLQQRAVHWYRLVVPTLSAGPSQKRIRELIAKHEELPAPLSIADKIGEVRRFKAHPGAATCLALSTNGKLLYTGGVDGNVRSWDAATGKLLSTFAVGMPVVTFAVSPDLRYLVACSLDRAKSFDYRTKLPIAKDGVDSKPGAFFSKSDEVFRANAEGTLWAQNVVTGVGPGAVQRQKIKAIVASPDNDWFVSIGPEGAWLHARNSTYGFLQADGQLLSSETVAAAFSADGKVVAIAGKDRTIQLFDTSTKRRLAQVATDLPTLRALAFTPNKQRLLFGGDDKCVHIWDLEAKKEVHCFNVLTTTVTALVVAPDGQRAFSVGTDGFVRQWTLPRDKK